MTERGLPVGDMARACPFVAFDDARDDRADRPDPRHRCYAESPPAPRARAHQEAYCLSANFPVCPTFQDWAGREAARVVASASGGSPAERLRDVPAQRVAGERPPTFGPGSAGGTAADRGSGAAAGDPGGPDDDDGRSELRDLPQRRANQPNWSAPPPWVADGGAGRGASGEISVAARDDVDRVVPRDDWDADEADRPQDDEPDAPAVAAPPDREAAMARLRALSLGATPARTRSTAVDDEPIPPIVGRRPVTPPPAAPPPRGARGGTGTPGRSTGTPGRSTGVVDAGGGAPAGPQALSPVSAGLARILRFARRPPAPGGRPTRQVEREPAWEQPRRFEAYPALKTRSGMPTPPRLLVAVGAVLLAAAILFFVPALLLKPGGGSAATASPSAAASGSGATSAAPSTPAPTPTAPKQTVYTVRQGDTLLRIATRFGVTVEALRAANKNIKDPNKIAIGDKIIIPSAAPSEIIDGGPTSTP